MPGKFDVAGAGRLAHGYGMSAAEILSELPKLTHQERRAISRRLLELEENQEALLFATEATALAFQELDRLEEADAGQQTR